jgi:long-chain acyl-CoA synthetase
MRTEVKIVAPRDIPADTFPRLLALNAVQHPDEIALREKDFGIWCEFTWVQYHERVRQFAYGLLALGIKPDDVVALLGDNRAHWLMAEIAIHAAGGLSLGIYSDALEEELDYLVNFAAVRGLFVEDEEQVDKLLALEGRIRSVEHIVYFDPRGMRKYTDRRLISIAELRRRGEVLRASQPDLYERLTAQSSGERAAILCTTSGTTAHPKLSMLSPARLLAHCARYVAVDPKGPGDEYVSVLPLAWIMEQIYALGEALLTRMRVNFVEEPATTMHDLREIGPTFLLLPPRTWEQIAADVRARVMDASTLKRWLFELGMRLGMDALARGERSRIADLLLFRALRDRLGFSRLRSAATGGASLGPDTFRFFHALGVPLRQLYGQTELMGAYTIHRPGDVDFDTVGLPFSDDIEIRLDAADRNGIGEILTRHPNMFIGYYGSDKETANTLDEGWMRTGDAGYFDGKGHLVVVDRVRDLAATATGSRFSPQYIENKLKFSPFIAEAVVLGDRRPHLAAILCIRYSIVSKWAERQRIGFTTYSDLAAKPQVQELLAREVARVNAALPSDQQVKRFVLLYKELDADDGELTRTRKVRRGIIAERYHEIIDALFSGKHLINVDTTVSLQDGTKQRIRTQVRVTSLGIPPPAVPADATALST